MSLKVTFAKDRQKFSAAHFTIFADGSAERLHGHNYEVSVSLETSHLELGLIAPFHLLKKVINDLCKTWDEMILLATQLTWATCSTDQGQVNYTLSTPLLCKRYSFPEEDVVLLECDNISCENLVRLFTGRLIQELSPLNLSLSAVEVAISESRGQTVSTRHNYSSNDPLKTRAL